MQPFASRLPFRLQETTLRPLVHADLDTFHAYRSDSVLAAFQGWSPMSVEATRKFIEEMSSVSALRAGDWIQLGIAEAGSNSLVGDVGIYLEEDETVAEIGFTLCRAAQGLGHATRALQASLALVFSTSAVEAVRAVTDVRNVRSVHLLERLNFERILIQEAVFKGEPCTESVYVYRRTDA